MLATKRSIVLAFVLSMCALMLVALHQLAQAETRAVDISSFTASAQSDNSVTLELDTETEDNVMNWHIKRVISGTDFIAVDAANWMDDVISVTHDTCESTDLITDTIIPACGSSISGKTYVMQDRDSNLMVDETYCYTFVEVQDNSDKILHAEDYTRCVTIGVVTTYGVELIQIITGAATVPGGTTTHTVRILNTGSDTSDFFLQQENVNGDDWGLATLNGSNGILSIPSLGAGMSTTVDVVVTAPQPLDVAVSQLRLTVADALSSPNVTDMLTVESRIGAQVFVPIVIKP